MLSAEVVLSEYPAHSISSNLVFSVWETVASLFLTDLCASDAQTTIRPEV